MTWSSGYVADVEYTSSYYSALNPNTLRLACVASGFQPPAMQDLHYLELGFGQGMSLNVHAASIPGVYWGTDFMPIHAAGAQAMAKAAGSAAVLLDESFADFSQRQDLPDFDIIALHGVWTWISEDARHTVVDIIRRKLKVGGLLYVGYNTHPGYAPIDPVRRLMTFYSTLAPQGLGTLANVDMALKFVQQLADSGAKYFKVNPFAKEYLGTLSTRDRKYLAHELFNRDWALMTFSEMVERLTPAKVDFATSAHFLDQIDVRHLPAPQQQILAGLKHPILFEATKDFLVSQRFRRDIFIKGPRRLRPMERDRLLKEQAFVLTGLSGELPQTVMWTAGEQTLQDATLYRSIVEVLAENSYAMKTLGELHEHQRLKMLSLDQLIEAVLLLTGTGHLSPAQSPSSESKKRCAALNRYICDLAADGGSDIHVLASPLTGSGVKTDRLQQLFMLALCQNKLTVEDQAQFAWAVLSKQGQFAKGGKVITARDEGIAHLTNEARTFGKKTLPLLKALEVEVACPDFSPGA